MARSWIARRARLVLWLTGSAVLSLANGVAAAGPSADPSASPSGPVCPDPYVAWFDQPLPRAAPAGQQIPVGVTVWDCMQNALAFAESAEIHVHPKTGKAAPGVFPSRSDWPGHLVSTIEVPKGGLGSIEVGFRGQECHDDGTCTDTFFPFGSGGSGPPPDASLAVLVNARITSGTDPIVAGHLFDVVVDVEARAAWDPATIPWPDHMVIEAQVVGGDISFRSDARSATGTGSPYTGQLTVPDPGDYVLHAGFPTGGGPDQMIDGAVTRITIEPGDGSTQSLPPERGSATPPTDGSSLPVLPIAVGLAVIGALAFVVQRVFADL